jgi:hypothetical protein
MVVGASLQVRSLGKFQVEPELLPLVMWQLEDAFPASSVSFKKAFCTPKAEKSSLWQYFRRVDKGLGASLAKDLSHCCVALFATFLYTRFLLAQSQVILGSIDNIRPEVK